MKLIRDSQKDAILSMLNLNSKASVDSASTVWKVLVYDKMGQDIISPLLKVGELREQGITVHMSLHTDRQPIPDVPAVYFVQPTEANVRRIADDFARKLYDTYYINFCYTVPRPLLEELAAAAVQTQAVANVAQVYDQFLNYVSLESALFSVNMDSCFLKLNHPQARDTEIEAIVQDIVSSLYAVIMTLDTMPVIRCPKGNAAEMIATKLESRLRDHYLNSRSTNAFKEPTSSSRPVLIILDRTVDLVTMLSHSWTYSSMMHDVLNMNLNRLTITTENGALQKYDIDMNDFFWMKNAGAPFPQVAEDVNGHIVKYKEDVEKVTKSCGVNSLEEIGDSTTNLKVAITAMPELTERKRVIDMHMNIALNMMNVVKSRQLDVFFSLEEAISKQSKSAVLEQIRDPSKAQEDKLRLALIYYLSQDGQEIYFEMESALKEIGVDIAPLKYIKSIKSFLKMTTTSGQQVSSTSAASDLFGRFSSISSKLTDSLQNAGVMTSGLDSFIASVKNLLPSSQDLPITKIVDNITEDKGPEAEDYLFLDPKQIKKTLGSPGKSSGNSGYGQNKQTYNDTIVFVVGGGNYLEYHNLCEYVKSREGRKTVVYGASDLPNPSNFLSQLSRLASS